MFNQIIIKRPQWRLGIDPLWKLDITNGEYQELKDYLYDKIILNIPVNRWHHEAALYFAEWWKREYIGGPHNRQDVAKSLDLETSNQILYAGAKEGARTLRNGVTISATSGVAPTIRQ